MLVSWIRLCDRKKRLERDVSRILFPPCGGGGYLSGLAIARGDERPTRPGTGHPMRGRLALLRMWFALPPMSPQER